MTVMAFTYSLVTFLLAGTTTAALNAYAVPSPYPLRRHDSPARVNASSSTTYSEYIGSFTAGGGIYPVTSVSDVVIVAGHTLSQGGGNAVVGGVYVTDAASGLLQDGSLVPVTPVTGSSTTISTVITSNDMTTTATTEVPVSAASSTSSGGGAMFTGVPAAGAVMGGLLGVMLL